MDETTSLSSSTHLSTQTWLIDLKDLFTNAEKRFADVVWDVSASPPTSSSMYENQEQDDFGSIMKDKNGKEGTKRDKDNEIWGHKGVSILAV